MFDEIKYRYKALSLQARLLVVALIACGPGAFTYFDQISALEDELAAATTRESAARQKLAGAKAQVKNLPAMEEKLTYTTDQMKKAEARLPSFILVEKVLEQIGKTANDSQVSIKKFTPTGEQTIEGEYSYDEVRFKISMEGKFGALGRWMDQMGGNESKAYIRAWEYSRSKVDEVGSGGLTQERSLLSPREIAEKSRNDSKLNLDVDVVYYRVASAKPVVQTPPTAAKPDEKAPAKPETKSDQHTEVSQQKGGAA